MLKTFRFSLLAMVAFVAATLAASAQTTPDIPEVQFENRTHDFGILTEEQGNAPHVFRFTNKGTRPVKIVDVKPSCGCTTPKWSQETVAPGQSGQIEAIYSTIGRPGPFEKSILVRVKLDGEEAERVVVLIIKGNVTPRKPTIADRYPGRAGNLALSDRSSMVNLGDVFAGQKKQGVIKLMNMGANPITIKQVIGPTFVQVSVAAGTVLKAQDTLVVPVIFDSKAANDWGYVFHSVLLATDDVVQPEKYINVGANITEDFTQLPEAQRNNPPVASFATMQHNFGAITKGQVLPYTFTVTNTGRTDLVIRKVKPTCGCTASEPTRSLLKPGESADIKVTFNSEHQPLGVVEKYITVITNDPLQPVISLAFRADIQAAPAPANAPAPAGR